MYVQYYALEDKQLSDIQEMDSDEILDFLDEQDENEEAHYADIDKSWQWLSYILTGSNFSDWSFLGISIFGEKIIDEEEYKAIISKEKISKILENLKKVNIQEKIANTSFEEMTKQEIYPNFWLEEDREELTTYLQDNFECLIDFYEIVLKKNLNVLVTLW